MEIKRYQVNTNKKKVGSAVLISGKVEFAIKNTKQGKENH